MEDQLQTRAEDSTRLRGCVSDLVRIMALPAFATDDEPSRIVSTFLDELIATLRLSFAFLRLNDPHGSAFLEMARVAEPLNEATSASEIGEALKAWLGDAPLTWPKSAKVSIGKLELSAASAPLGLRGELGLVVAGSQKADFPGQTDTLILHVAAYRAALALLQARSSEYQQISGEQENRVARRTLELGSTNPKSGSGEIESRLIIDSIPGLVAIMSATGEVEFVNRQLLTTSTGHWRN